MDIAVRLLDLPVLHPELLWESILTAAAAVFDSPERQPPHPFRLRVENVLGFGSEDCRLLIDLRGVTPGSMEQVRRTYEASRLVELAAIAIAGLALHHLGEHEIVDVAVRGSGADYLVDRGFHHLEIAGRSRRSDFEFAWRQRWDRLATHYANGFYLLVAEFEEFSGRLAFAL